MWRKIEAYGTLLPKTSEQLKGRFTDEGEGLVGDALYQKIIETSVRQAKELGCFVVGTLVHTREGLKPIEQIKVGDYVLSKPESGIGEPAYRRVTRTFGYDERGVYFVTWNVIVSEKKWYEQESGYVVVTGAHPFWVKCLVDEATGEVKEVNSWMSIEEFYSLNFEMHWAHNKAGLIAQVELQDGRVAQLGLVQPILQTNDPNTGVGFEDDIYWGDSGSGPAIEFRDDGPFVELLDCGRYRELQLDLENVVPYHDYPERSIVRRSGGFLPLRRKVLNLEVEGFHTYYVGEAGLLVHNTSGIIPKTIPTNPIEYPVCHGWHCYSGHLHRKPNGGGLGCLACRESCGAGYPEGSGNEGCLRSH